MSNNRVSQRISPTNSQFISQKGALSLVLLFCWQNLLFRNLIVIGMKNLRMTWVLATLAVGLVLLQHVRAVPVAGEPAAYQL